MDGKKFFCLMTAFAALVLILVISIASSTDKNNIDKKMGAAVHYNMAKDLYRQGQYKEATDELSKALDLNDRDSWIFLEFGKNYVKLDKPEQAIKCLKKSIHFNHNNTETYITLAQIYNDKFDYDETIRLLNPLAQKNDGMILTLLAEAQYNRNNISAAEENLKKAIAKTPGIAKNYNYLGLVYLRQNKISDAITRFRKAIFIDKTFTEARCNLAKALWLDDKPSFAVVELENSLDYNTSDPETYYLLGKIYAQNNMYQKANDNFIKIFQINQADISRDMLEDIVKELENIANKNQSASVYNTLAIAYSKLNKNSEAIKAYERAIKGNIKDPLIYNNLASLYFQDNNIKKAVFYYNLALKLNPKESVYYYDLGNCCKKLKDNKQAIKNYYKALELNSSLNIARIALGDIYKEKGNFTLAENLYNQAIRKNQSEPYAYLGLSEIATKQGLQAKAARYKSLYLQYTTNK